MATLVTQGLTGVLVLFFGFVALLVGRSVSGGGARSTSWVLIGAVFTFSGVMGLVQQLAGIHAFVAGPGSSSWETYLRWAPAANHSRGALSLGFMIVLATVSLQTGSASRKRWAAMTGALLIATLLGAVVGWMEAAGLEPRGYEVTHYTALAVSSGTLTIAAGVALVVHLVRETMDRLLWICLCVYGVHLAVSSVFLGALAWIAIPGAWYPSAVSGRLADLATAATMLGIASHAWRQTRRGVYIPALMERPQAMRTAAVP